MSDVKHKIFVGYDLPEDVDGAIIITPTVAFTADSTVIKADSTTRTADETT
jgi:hypothetical protein